MIEIKSLGIIPDENMIHEEFFERLLTEDRLSIPLSFENLNCQMQKIVSDYIINRRELNEKILNMNCINGMWFNCYPDFSERTFDFALVVDFESSDNDKDEGILCLDVLLTEKEYCQTRQIVINNIANYVNTFSLLCDNKKKYGNKCIFVDMRPL